MKHTFILLSAAITIFFCVGGAFNNVCAQNTNSEHHQSPENKVHKNQEDIEAIYQFIAQNLEFLTKSGDSIAQGRLYISFKVEEDGSLRDFYAGKVVHNKNLSVSSSSEGIVESSKWKLPEIDKKPILIGFTCDFSIELIDPEKNNKNQ